MDDFELLCFVVAALFVFAAGCVIGDWLDRREQTRATRPWRLK